MNRVEHPCAVIDSKNHFLLLVTPRPSHESYNYSITKNSTISKSDRFCLRKWMLWSILGALHNNTPHVWLSHTLHSQQGEGKLQWTKYLPSGSPPFGAHFLSVSGCLTVSEFSFSGIRGNLSLSITHLWPYFLHCFFKILIKLNHV